MLKVIKRDGTKGIFEISKIENAVRKACNDTTLKLSDSEILTITQTAVLYIEKENYEEVEVEKIQDFVEKALKETDNLEILEAYKQYRKERNRIRETKTDIMKTVKAIGVETDRDNANVGNNFSAKLLRIASESNKWTQTSTVIPKEFSKLHENGDLYFHDLDSYNLTTNCIGENEYLLLRNNINGKNSWIKFSELNEYFTEENKIKNTDRNVETVKVNNISTLGRLGFTNINFISRRKLKENEQMYRLNTRRNKGIYCTGEHKIPIIRDGKELLLEAKQITKNDKLILTTSVNNDKNIINIIDLFSENHEKSPFGITFSGAQQLQHWLKYKYGNFNHVYAKDRKTCSFQADGISAEEYKYILDNFDIDYEVKNRMTVNCIKGKRALPAFLPITPELARIIGYVVSEGHMVPFSKGKISFSNKNESILEDMRKCIKIAFPDYPISENINKNGVTSISFGGSTLNLLFSLLNVKMNAGNINIPDFILNSNDDIKLNFLAAAFDGDGSVGNNQVIYSSCCENFIDKMMLLLKYFDIDTHKYSSNCKGSNVFDKDKNIVGKRNYDHYGIKILDTKSLNNFINTVNKIKIIKNANLEDYAKNVTSSNKNSEEIIRIDIINGYTGYVYDLETDEHWFNVNGYIVHNCLHIPTRKMLTEGFNTGYGTINPPQRIESAAELSCILLQASQNN